MRVLPEVPGKPGESQNEKQDRLPMLHGGILVALLNNCLWSGSIT